MNIKQKLALWLWEVLARPMLEHIDKWANHHADTARCARLIDRDRSEQSLDRLGDEFRGYATSQALELRTIRGHLERIEEALHQHADFRQFEAVSFAAEKLILDRDFWKEARGETRITAVADWAKIYSAKNNWPIPSEQRLRSLVCAKLEQIETRKVGPMQ